MQVKSQDTAALHLCIDPKRPSAPLCVKVFDKSGEAKAAAIRECSFGNLLATSYPDRDQYTGFVRFLWSGEYEGQYFIVQPYYSVNLQWLLSECFSRFSVPMPVANIARIAIGLAYALHQLHRLRQAHCDVKPANIMLDADGWPVLVDFGSATVFDDKPHETTEQWIVPAAEGPSKQSLKEKASAALDLHCLASTIFVAHRPEYDENLIMLRETSWRDESAGARLVECCWNARDRTASHLLKSLIDLCMTLPNLLTRGDIEAKVPQHWDSSLEEE